MALQGALLIVTFIAGILLAGGAWLLKGLILGGAAIFSQIVVGYLLARAFRMPPPDRLHLAFAQQNGITASPSCSNPPSAGLSRRWSQRLS